MVAVLTEKDTVEIISLKEGRGGNVRRVKTADAALRDRRYGGKVSRTG